MTQGSIGLMLGHFAVMDNGYELAANKELGQGERIKFKLTPHGYGEQITHWHIMHILSNKLFIVLA